MVEARLRAAAPGWLTPKRQLHSGHIHGQGPKASTRMWVVRSLLLAAAVLATSAAPALADKGGRHRGDGWMAPEWALEQRGDRGDRGGDERRQDIRPLREIVSMMRSRFGGDLINARLENGERPFYVLRWRMPNSDVRDFEVDAESGQIR